HRERRIGRPHIAVSTSRGETAPFPQIAAQKVGRGVYQSRTGLTAAACRQGLQYARHRGDFDIHADDPATHYELDDVIAARQQHPDDPIGGVAVGDIQHEATAAVAETPRELL